MGTLFNRGHSPGDERALWGISGAGDLIPRRTNFMRGAYGGTLSEARKNSAIWAAIRLRADLISTLPINCFRYAAIDDPKNPDKLNAPLSPFMTGPDWMEWVYSSQDALDSTGNAIGKILEKDKLGYPTNIRLYPTEQCGLTVRDYEVVEWNLGGETVKPEWVWHEKQFTAPGLAVGLSPVAHAAMTSGLYASVQDFARQWFTSGQGPRASLRNTEKKLNPKSATIVKEAWRASQAIGEPFVHGSDWEYNLLQAQSASNDWLEAQKLSLNDVSRFFGVPAALIDAALAGGSSLTYANVSQRMLQFLVLNLGPAIARRENAFSNRLLPRPRQVEFDTDRLLRMDPQTRAEWIKSQIESRVLTPNEGRKFYDRKPLTDADYKQWELAGLNKTATGALTGAENLPTPAGTQTEPVPPVDPNAPPADNNAPPTDQGNTK